MKKERSRAYPRYSLEECIRSVRLVRDGLGSGQHDRDSVARAMGQSPNSGAAASRIGAMAQYGLLDKSTSGYSVSGLAAEIMLPRNETEHGAALRHAALTPRLFREVYDRFLPDGFLPSSVENILARDFGVVPAATVVALDSLKQTFRFAGLLDDNDRFVAEPDQTPDLEEAVSDGAAPANRDTESEVETTGTGPGQHDLRLALGGGRSARLIVPSDVTAREIEALKKQFEVIVMLMGASEDDTDGGE